MRNVIQSYRFHFLDTVAPQVLTLHSLGLEHHYSDYDWPNEKRIGDTWLFQYTLSGEGRLNLAGEEHVLPSGTGFLLPIPSQSRYWLEEKAKAGWRFIWVMFNGQAAEQYIAPVAQQHGAVFSLAPDSPAISALLQMHRKAQAGIINDEWVAKELTFLFLCRLCASLNGPNEALRAPVEKALKLIEEEFQTLEGVGEVARRLKLSPEHLARIFAAQTGSTLVETLTHTRLRHAAQLLLTSELNLEEIACQCGYLNGNYFGKVFKKSMGVSPARFRREAQAHGFSDILV